MSQFKSTFHEKLVRFSINEAHNGMHVETSAFKAKFQSQLTMECHSIGLLILPLGGGRIHTDTHT